MFTLAPERSQIAVRLPATFSRKNIPISFLYTGLLITFVQFFLTALLTWPHHFSARSPTLLKSTAVPLARLIPNAAMFFAVNLLNNMAFGYRITVPVHIILRSAGSALTMLVGYVSGKRYSRVQVFSIAILTVGVVVAALSDARSKVSVFFHLSLKCATQLKKQGRTIPLGSMVHFDREFLTGLFILFVAQLLAAIMGLYTQLTYAKYGSHWHENLFYIHFLSIPLFMPFAPFLLQQFQRLLSSQPVMLSPSLDSISMSGSSQPTKSGLPGIHIAPTSIAVPSLILNLLLNATTQYACIRGVNTLAAQTSAIGVTIVLNLRKLISLLFSIWWFGTTLPPGVVIGAAMVFGSAGLWAWDVQGSEKRDKERKDK